MTLDSAACRSHCPINLAAEVFGDKWTLLVIRDLMFKGKRRYGEFLESDEAISTNLLADRLRKLEHWGLIERRQGRAYALTSVGLALLPVMVEITAWSARHDPLTNTPAAFLTQYEHDREALIASLAAAHAAAAETS